jgi:hypothetical protein
MDIKRAVFDTYVNHIARKQELKQNNWYKAFDIGILGIALPTGLCAGMAYIHNKSYPKNLPSDCFEINKNNHLQSSSSSYVS